MTRLLLDTHAFVWAVSQPDRLGEAARRSITDPSTELLVSAATAWELVAKVHLGRLSAAEVIVAQYDEVVRQLGARHLDITSRHALRSGGLRWAHRDPFDRMLAAQALLEQATLVTVDRVFHDLGGLTIVW